MSEPIKIEFDTTGCAGLYATVCSGAYGAYGRWTMVNSPIASTPDTAKDQQRIQELEAQVKELNTLLWQHVELATMATKLITELSKHRKPGTEENDSEHLDLLIGCRSALLTCKSLTEGTLLDDLGRSIDTWRQRVGDNA